MLKSLYALWIVLRMLKSMSAEQVHADQNQLLMQLYAAQGGGNSTCWLCCLQMAIFLAQEVRMTPYSGS
jgi:hypothetical protein